LAFVRDAAMLRAAMSLTAAYLPQGEHREPSQYVPELSRRARGVEIWAALKSLGRNGLAELIERNCRSASRFAAGLSEAGFEVLNEVALNQVLVSFGPPDVTERVIQAIQEDGTCWCGSTIWQGRHAMRISVSSWATTDADVDRSLAAITRIALCACRFNIRRRYPLGPRGNGAEAVKVAAKWDECIEDRWQLNCKARCANC
jgi:glutamate/tyrosine decarboxylase-like PLP-dependent enzyme